MMIVVRLLPTIKGKGSHAHEDLSNPNPILPALFGHMEGVTSDRREGLGAVVTCTMGHGNYMKVLYFFIGSVVLKRYPNSTTLFRGTCTTVLRSKRAFLMGSFLEFSKDIPGVYR